MKYLRLLLVIGFLTTSCSGSSIEQRGFQVSQISESEEGEKVVGISLDSLKIETSPRNVLLTYHPAHRLTPIYKVNYHKKTKQPFTGSTAYHEVWNRPKKAGNNWNRHFMPGFEAVYGYNFVNVSHYNHETQTAHTFFSTPVLIKTLYYPAFTKDTLNDTPVERNFYMVSAYDEDSNSDGFINTKDLRRLYYFDLNGQNKRLLIPENYTVMSSEYDPANDLMYVFAKKDENQNGQLELNEPSSIFWIDLKNPQNVGKQYEVE